tara:strand:- start:1082 stop:1267 length:186 start_codon:yes stop_codon:yes gene_type:complete
MGSLKDDKELKTRITNQLLSGGIFRHNKSTKPTLNSKLKRVADIIMVGKGLHTKDKGNKTR